MKIDIDLSSLLERVKEMGAGETDFQLGEVWVDEEIEIDKELSSSGIKIRLEDLEIKQNLITYKGRQVVLFIPDHSSYRTSIEDVIENSEKGNKFHVADCETLDKMKRDKRFDRYMVTNSLEGTFEIYGQDQHGNEQRATVKLNVCKYCLKLLNYKGAAATDKSGRNKIVAEFDPQEFFETYSHIFKELPKQKKSHNKPGYTDDWPKISKRYREQKNYRCEQCKVSLKNNQNLLDVHHISGKKRDNSENNLQALCKLCHSEQPSHSHYKKKVLMEMEEDANLIRKLRREQNL